MSISWSSRPDRGDASTNYQLARCPRSGTLRGVILSRSLQGTGTHYYRGRTTPCVGAKCEACKDGMAARWYGYVAIWSPSTDRVAIAEITDAAADDLDRWHARHGTLRGAVLTLKRQGARVNGRIIADVSQGTIDPDRLPPPPDLIRILEKIWGLNTNAPIAGTIGRKSKQARGDGREEQAADGTVRQDDEDHRLRSYG